MNALQTLEAEAIHILRETAAQFERPFLLYRQGFIGNGASRT